MGIDISVKEIAQDLSRQFQALLADQPKKEVPETKGVFVQDLGVIDGIHGLFVTCLPNTMIPMHTHACASGMDIVRGSAMALKEGRSIPVFPGDSIYKKPNQPHGFEVSGEGLTFLSLSDESGILKGDSWDFDVL